MIVARLKPMRAGPHPDNARTIATAELDPTLSASMAGCRTAGLRGSAGIRAARISVSGGVVAPGRGDSQ
jgi:hypothetical protein